MRLHALCGERELESAAVNAKRCLDSQRGSLKDLEAMVARKANVAGNRVFSDFIVIVEQSSKQVQSRESRFMQKQYDVDHTHQTTMASQTCESSQKAPLL
jgi:hypothetical protein